MDWLEITVYTDGTRLDALVEKLEELDVEGLVINDEASVRDFLETNRNAWDYVGEEVFDHVRDGSSVQFYLEDNVVGRRRLDDCRTALAAFKLSVQPVRDEDWLHNWRRYFKPLEIGRRLLVVPAWEEPPAGTDRLVLRIEPGQAFGTGGHASTRMCLAELENHRAASVLDLGCGSGILAVAALLFGADEAVCCDIAQDAETVCRDNARLNGISPERIRAVTGDILNDEALRRMTGGTQYDIVFANIIADVIIPLARHVGSLLAPDGVFICSGIIDGRQDEVRDALDEAGLETIAERCEDDWHMYAARRVVPRAQL